MIDNFFSSLGHRDTLEKPFLNEGGKKTAAIIYKEVDVDYLRDFWGRKPADN